MSEKRKDSKGRILKTGESQRKDGRYQYRYTDSSGNRYTIYAQTLRELREKEEEVQKAKYFRIDYKQGRMTVSELCDKYMAQKANIRPSTKNTYNHRLNAIRKDTISQLSIADVTMSDVKEWCIRQNKYYPYDTIRKRLAMIRSAFDLACADGVLYNNPCNFKLNSVLLNETQSQIALTNDEISVLLHEMQSNPYSARYYHMVILMLHTGIRIGECLGLTVSDVDFENRILHINKQSVWFSTHHHITTPKTKSGIRDIPLDDAAFNALKDEIEFYPPIDFTLDGYQGFIFHTDKDIIRGTVVVKALARVVKRHNSQLKEGEVILPRITPHTLRHTFCSHMVEKKMSPVALQYIMGHSNIDVTMGTYTHPSYKWIMDEFYKAF